MSDFDHVLGERLEKLSQSGLRRSLREIDSPQGVRLRIKGHSVLNFASNDYLGLANDDRVKAAAIEATQRYGAGSGASRLICGSLAPHHELEQALAHFKGCEAAIAFSSGYSAALGAICALVGKDDVLVLDKLVHASIVDAARLSGAKLRVFAHNDLNELADILAWVKDRDRKGVTLIVTESIFSMDGDQAPLREIVELKEKHGAWLMVDEAHATGLYGSNGAGLAHSLGLNDRIEVHLGTLGKALGSAGGFICGSRKLTDFCVNRARSFIFSTAPPPSISAAATAALALVQSTHGASLRQSLWQRVHELASELGPAAPSNPGAIIPLILGDEARAMKVADALFEAGLLVPGIRFPSVPRGQARLRVTLSAAHTAEDVRALADALARQNLQREAPTALRA